MTQHRRAKPNPEELSPDLKDRAFPPEGHEPDSDRLHGGGLVAVRESRAQLSLGGHRGLGTGPCFAYLCPDETLPQRIHCSFA